MTNIQLYTGEQDNYYSQEQISELNKPLDQRLVSQRKGGGNRTLNYIEGHDAIDQANRIFGYGNWAYRPISLEQVVLIDPIDGVAVGIEYKALVELTVRGAIAPIVDVGSQPVATWSVEDQVMGRRVNDARYNHKEVDESPFTLLEKRNARAVIVEAHEQAKKGAVTDALKRCLRVFGNQFGNGLYGDGHVNLDEPAQGSTRVIEDRPRQIAPPQKNQPEPAAQSDAVKDMIRKAKGRAGKAKIASNADQWSVFVSQVLGGPKPDAQITLQDIARINGELTKREQAQPAQA